MAILRTDIERALDELVSQEEGMRFQGLAVVLGKKHWPELIAHERKKDLGLDAYAPPSLTQDKIGKGLAASITSTLRKISADAKAAKENFPELKALLFVTPAKVGTTDRRNWEVEIRKDHDLEIHIIGREEIITQMMLPENASLCASFLHLATEAEPQVADLIERTKRAADSVVRAWAGRTKGRPLIELTAVRLDQSGKESADVLSLDEINQALSQSRRIVLEGPAGRGKTTTLVQLAQRVRAAGTPFIVELPAWTSSRRGILEYVAGMPAFQAEGLTAVDLARVLRSEPLLFLLNGWNEIAESNSAQADAALRELERDFPGSGVIVATRTHHLTPPLPGALRLRLLRLRRAQRAAYLANRLGADGGKLQAHIDSDPSLDELTRLPFILSEVASLFEAGAKIPTTKIGVLAEVLRLQEQLNEHKNALQGAPIFGRQEAHLQALATEMTQRGAVALAEADARTVVARATRELAEEGQIESVGAPGVLATLTAHHVLERVDYPESAFQFEHQQLQEYYAALGVRTRLLELRADDHNAMSLMTARYVNDPAWAEPLRMVAETFAERTGDAETDKQNASVGQELVRMALTVDLVFASELVHLCGPAVWNEVRETLGERFRAAYAIGDGRYRQYALAAMLATGADEFKDIIAPLLSGQDQQTRLRTYRLWPDMEVSLLGPNWRDEVRRWSEEARVDFVSELLHHRSDGEISAFAAEDNSAVVKEAAVSGLMWTGSEELLIRVLGSMDAAAFENVARKHAEQMPAALRARTIAAMRRFVETTTDHPARLGTMLKMVELGETGLQDVVKDALGALTRDETRNLGSYSIQLALEYLRKTNSGWASEWVATRIAEGALYEHEFWLPLATAIPDGLVEKYLSRLETEDLENARFEGMTAVIAARADAELAARVFVKLRELRRKIDAGPGQHYKFEWQLTRQLEAVFRRLPDDIAVAGALRSVSRDDPLDLKVAADLLSRVARQDVEPLRFGDDNLKARLREYLKSGVDLVLRREDYNGEEKANLASAIAQVGQPGDMADLMTLIRADIERMRRGRAARAAGDHGLLGNGGSITYAGWHIEAVMHLDPSGAEQVLIDLLREPEYRSDAANAMAREFMPRVERPFGRTFRYDLMWTAREGRASPLGDDQRRTRFAAALSAEINRLQEEGGEGKPAGGVKELARALAAIDGRGSAALVLDAIAKPGQWDQYVRLDAAERLLMAGVVLSTTQTFALVDSILERTEKWMQDSDKNLLRRILALLPFIDNPAAGIARIGEVLVKRRLWGYELRGLVTALGYSHSDAAVGLLYELASNAQTLEQFEEEFINALAALDTPRARDLLLSAVDPDIRGVALTHRHHQRDVLVAQLTELVKRAPEVAARLLRLCERDLPEPSRQVLSKIMARLGTPEAIAGNLNLIDDARPSPVPEGIWTHLQNAFVERRPYGQESNAFTQHARASNELRAQLFRMVLGDQKRRKSASRLLGQIEEWRLEYGRPLGEPRHPDFASGQPWPPRT